MFTKKDAAKVEGEKLQVKKEENPTISFELLPNGKVFPRVYWEPHSSFNAVLLANVINLLNEGKLYDVLKQSIINQGVLSGDNEVAEVIVKNLRDPGSIEDEEPVIRAGAVTRFHFNQQQ